MKVLCVFHVKLAKFVMCRLSLLLYNVVVKPKCQTTPPTRRRKRVSLLALPRKKDFAFFATQEPPLSCPACKTLGVCCVFSAYHIHVHQLIFNLTLPNLYSNGILCVKRKSDHQREVEAVLHARGCQPPRKLQRARNRVHGLAEGNGHLQD